MSEKDLGLTRRIVQEFFLEGMRRNNGKDIIHTTGFRAEFKERTVGLQKRTATNCTVKFCLYKQLCKPAYTYANFT